MPTLEKAIGEFTIERIESAWETLQEKEQIQQLNEEISSLQIQINEVLPDGIKESFQHYCECINHRDSIIYEEIYRAGFGDSTSIFGRFHSRG